MTYVDRPMQWMASTDISAPHVPTVGDLYEVDKLRFRVQERIWNFDLTFVELYIVDTPDTREKSSMHFFNFLDWDVTG